MVFTIKEHSGISPKAFERPFFLKHLAPYIFSKALVKGKKVLEIGFGDGYGSFYLVPYARALFSIDLFLKNAVNAQEKYQSKNLRFLIMNGYKLAFRKKVFDVVIAFQLIEHLPRTFHNVFLQEVKRVLKDGGIFVLTTPNALNLDKKGKGYEKNPHHDLEFTYEMLKDILVNYFNAVDMYTVNYSTRQKFFLRVKKLGVFKYFQPSLNVVERYFKNMSESDFVVKKANVKRAPDLLAVCSNPM